MTVPPAAPPQQAPTPEPGEPRLPVADRPAGDHRSTLAATLLRAPVAGATWRSYLYLLASAPLSLAAFVALVAAVWFAGLLSLTLVGIPLLAAIVLAAREYGSVPRALARELLGEHVEAPRRRRPGRPGFFPWLRASLADLDGWRAMAYVIVSFPVNVVGAWAVAMAWGTSAFLLAYPVIWQVVDPVQTDEAGEVHRSVMQFGGFYLETWPRAIGVSVVGLAAMFVVPWLARFVTTVDRLLRRGLLGPSGLSNRVEDLEATRASAVDDSAATLRRIERDLHDGTQARLVALAMHLDMARDELAGGDAEEAGLARAREILDRAHSDATEAIVELREVTRSIHPPALDRGLDAALATLAARSGVPVAVDAHLPVRPSPAIETIAYYCVAELLTNVAKHSGARRATVEVHGTGEGLHVRVTDDGSGGARLVDGRGLAGLAERVRTVDGRLTLSSSDGGPTVATVDLPLGV